MLFLFLFRKLKGYRFLVVLIMILTIIVVESEILLGLPLKYIPDRFTNCLDPGQFKDPKTSLVTSSWVSDLLNPIITPFDQIGGQQQDSKTDLQVCQQSLKSKNLPFPQHTKIGVAIFSVFMLLVLSLLGAAVAYVQLFLVSFIAQNLTARLRKQLFAHLERLTLDWYGKQKKGDLVQRVTGNIADIEKLVTDGMVDLLGGILTLVSAIAVMYIVSPQFTLISVAVLPALIVIVFAYTTGIKRAARRAARAAGEVADVATEDVGNITVVKAFNLEDREARRFNHYVNKNREAGLRAGGLQAQFTPLVTIFVAVGTTSILGIGAWVAAGKDASIFGLFIIPAGTVTIGTLILFLSYLKQLYQPMKDLSKLTNVATAAAAGAERIEEVLEQAPELTESKLPYNGPLRLRGDITFENVFFGYMPEKFILTGINLPIPAGKKVALVGLSGGGKTTLVKLIPRFYEVTQGSVKIDGRDSRLYPLSVLRQNVSMVLQDSVLFEGTVLENLKIARPEATIGEIIDAAQQAHIHETIMGWPDGYATLVRNQGKNFSGGQRQRMAIARAILSKAPILILDEPTASLDVEAEAEVLNALDKLVVGRTVLMITHRLITLGPVDEIIVLKDGRIVEQGTYKELRRAGGVFADLLKQQNRYNVEDVGKSIVASQYPHIAVGQGLRQVPPVVPRMPITPLPPQPLPAGQQHRPAAVAYGATPGRGYAQNGGQQRQAQMGNIPQQGFRSDNARVLVEIDGKIIREQPLNKPILTVGRLSSNDIPILADRVSRQHARIRWENGRWLIEDAESLNGISYQGNRIDSRVLLNGDRIMLAPKAILHYKAG